MKLHFIYLLFSVAYIAVSIKAGFVQRIGEDAKEFQRLIRLRTNVLVVIAKSYSDIPRDLLSTFEEVGKEVKGVAEILIVDCSEGKKLCKKFKFRPAKFELKHFSNGKFNKDYDRSLRAKSIIRFLKSPNEEAPWSEDLGSKDVIHIEEAKELMSVFRKETKRPVLLMFYTPWCGHCKRMKPEFASAATLMKKEFVFVGIDCQKTENYPLQQGFNVSGYPTILLMRGGELAGRYVDGPNREQLLEWLKNPEKQSITPEPEPAEEEEPWTSDHVKMLTDDSFDDFIAENPSVLVMFYAPWCGHCKRLKPDYEEAAKTSQGMLAAVDATKETNIAKKFKISGYPTIKYFGTGEFQFDVPLRNKDDILTFMDDPKEPPKEPESVGWESDDEVQGAVEFYDDETFPSAIRKKKNSMVIFYAPWCGHCKAAKPFFTEAAKVFADNPKVAFVAVDCTKSTSVCKDHEIQGFPTITYFRYGKDPVPYEGQRDKESFVSFMNSQINKKTEL